MLVRGLPVGELTWGTFAATQYRYVLLYRLRFPVKQQQRAQGLLDFASSLG